MKTLIGMIAAILMSPAASFAAPDMSKLDPAELERLYPLSMEERNRITADWIRGLQTQEQVDQVYMRLPSGPIPVGALRGQVTIRRETLKKFTDAMDMLGGGKTTQPFWKLLCGGSHLVECFAEKLWGGKKIYPVDSKGEYQLRNAISRVAAVSLGTALSRGGILVEALKGGIRENFNGETRYMMFPAKVYCGQSLLDSRRESIIIDYAYGDDFKPFVKGVDDLAGRNGILVRDEIRMVNPKLYLGRAYLERVFVLNFMLEPVNPVTDTKNACIDTIKQ
jgi:hypothetical protein